MTTVDAVVIGAGPNGLVAANDLADHGGRLTFRGKAAHTYDATIDDPKVARVVRRLQDLPGQLLFQYVDDTGDTHTIGSTEVNEFLQTHGSSTATAKTFCTWGASVMGAALLAHSPMPTTSREQSWVVNDAIRVVADRLGNTLAVCRSSYVHPRVYETFNTGELANRWTCQAPREPRGLSADERRFWELLGRMLVASELVSNVVRHTNVGGTLRVWDPKPDVPLRLEVADDDPNLPRAVSPHDGGGRGLHIVHEVSDAWGSEREGVGKVIWVEFDRSQRH